MNTRWSLMDLVTLSVIGISCGALFAGWNVLWGALTPPFALVLPLQYLLLAGTWVIAGPLAGLIIKRRGAALFGESALAELIWTGRAYARSGTYHRRPLQGA